MPTPRAFIGILANGGEMGALMRAFDWATSPVGAPEYWPQALRTAVRLILNCGHPMYIYWGPQSACFYNDAYRQSIGHERHPGSLGKPAREVWDEIWPIIGPQIEQVMSGRGATWHEHHLVPITRHGRLDNVYWTYSYSPIDDDTAANGVGGVLVVCSETTAMVSARAQAVAERERMARLFDQAPNFMVMLEGADHRIVLANASYQRLIGHSDVIGKTIDEVLPEAVMQGYLARLDEVLRTGKAFSARGAKFTFAKSADGKEKERYLDFIYQPVVDAAGHVTGIFVEGSDVTEQKNAERALKDLNSKLGVLVKQRTRELDRVWTHARDLMVVIGGDGIFRAIGPAWQEVFGFAPEEVTGRSFVAFVHPDDEAATRQALASAAGGNDLTNFVNRYCHKDGSARWISWHTSVEGDLVYAYGRDITREKHAVEALATSKARLRAIFETSHQFQGLLDCNGTVMDANTTSLLAIKATLADVVGKPFWDTPWFTRTAGMAEMVQTVIPTAALGVTIRQEICVDLPVGGWRWFDFVIRPMRDKQGAVVALIPEAMETTERKKAEEALHQVQKLEAMGQLTGGVAHDFNNLLTPIVATLDMLRRRGVGGEREQRLIAAAAQSADRARTLVHRLLAFARRQPLQPVPVDVANLIVGMAELIRRTSGPQIDVQVEIEDGVIVALADPNQLEMAILNLSVNARDAMGQGGVLKITATNEILEFDPTGALKPGHYVRISVCDTGAGMDEETLAHAIEPFFSTKGIGKGTGLGLSMVHGLASQLGGALRIASAPGMGTKVDFWIPASKEAIPRRPAVAPKPLAKSAVGTAMLVDDEEFVRLSTADMLTEMGFAVFEASSAQEALKAIDDGLKIDVLVTDHLMPGRTGVDLVAAMRRRWPSLPVLIISGFAEAEGIPPDLPRLTKPFRQEELASALTRLFEAA